MDDFQNYKTLEQTMMIQAASTNEPISGSIELLPLCNMNCDMCYVRLSRKEMESLGRMRTGKEWVDLGKEMAEAGTLFLLLTGGEPLLHPNFQEIYLGLRKLGMILTINTNATLIDEKWADFFQQYKPRRINITLYGADNQAYETLCHYPGGFDKVIHAVNLLKKRDIDVRLSGSATLQNVQDITSTYKIAEELNVPMATDVYMNPSIRERNKPFNKQSRLLPEEAAAAHLLKLRLEKGEEYFSAYKRTALDTIDNHVPGKKTACSSSCMAGRCSFTINWQGYMRPCVLSSEPTVPVFELGFKESWKQMTKGFSEIQYCSECSVCPRKALCRICPVAALAETGDYMKKPEYLCRYTKEIERLLRIPEEEDHE